MSRIKDLYAIEEGIDDLIPETKVDIDHIVTIVKDWAMSDPKSEDFIADNAQFELSDDGGQPCMVMANFSQLCDQLAQDKLDELIEQEHIDMTDKQYAEVIDKASMEIMGFYAGYSDNLCNDEFADYTRDKKYFMDELRERNGQC